MTIKFSVLILLFVILKMTNVIDWSWWWLVPAIALNVCWYIVRIIKALISWIEKT